MAPNAAPATVARGAALLWIVAHHSGSAVARQPGNAGVLRSAGGSAARASGRIGRRMGLGILPPGSRTARSGIVARMRWKIHGSRRSRTTPGRKRAARGAAAAGNPAGRTTDTSRRSLRPRGSGSSPRTSCRWWRTSTASGTPGEKRKPTRRAKAARRRPSDCRCRSRSSSSPRQLLLRHWPTLRPCHHCRRRL